MNSFVTIAHSTRLCASVLFLSIASGALAQETQRPKTLTASVQTATGLAPEVTDLNAKDVSYSLEAKLPDLPQAYLSGAPKDLGDGIPVGVLGVNGGDKEAILKFAGEIEAGQHGEIDSLLIVQHSKLLFESYYRRGRINYPH